MKNNLKKAILLIICVSCTLNMPLSVYAQVKNETVYVKLNENGDRKSVIVNEQLINSDNSKVINDYSDLKDILNLSNDAKYKLEGNKLIWQAEGRDIFYQGTTSKELPIDINISYKLDGKESKLKDILGKKGHIDICIKFTNKDIHSYYGKNIYTPFVITMGTIINADNNHNINVNNGKVLSNGTNNILIAIASPGLYESLNLEALRGFDQISYSFDTDYFELSSIYMIATSKILDIDDLSVFNKLDSLYESSSRLQDGINALTDASDAINNGMQSLNSNYELFNDGMKQVNDGAYELNNGMKKIGNVYNNVINSSVYQGLKETIPNIIENINSIENINDYLDSAINTTDDVTNTLISIVPYANIIGGYLNNICTSASTAVQGNVINTIDDYTTTVQTLNNFSSKSADFIIELYEKDPDNASNELKELYNAAINIHNNEDRINDISSLLVSTNNNLKNIINNTNFADVCIASTYLTNINANDITLHSNSIKNLLNQSKEIVTNNQQLISIIPTELLNVYQKIDEVESGIYQIIDGTNSLYEGINELYNNSNIISEALNTLSNGTNRLNAGMMQYNHEGINKLTSFIDNNVKNTAQTLNYLNKLGEEYNSFAGNNDEGETKFVLVVDGIKIKKDVTMKNKTTKKLGFWQRIKNIFK